MTSPARRAPRGPLADATSAVSYTERGSQFPVLGALICGGLLAAGVAGLIAVGGPNGPGGRGGGAAGLGFLLAALIGAGYLAFAVADLPNGIRISAGQFTAGTGGGPTAGRLWRRVSGSLDAVLSWEILSREQVRALDAERRAQARAGRRRIYLGDLRLFGRRQVLRLTVDPALVDTRFPARVQAGYGSVPTGRAGGVWDGVVLIGTRRPTALAAALEQALPGRSGPGQSGAG
jgi:hypothetical protein